MKDTPLWCELRACLTGCTLCKRSFGAGLHGQGSCCALKLLHYLCYQCADPLSALDGCRHIFERYGG